MTAPEPLAWLDALAETHGKATKGWNLLGGTHEGVVIDDRGDFVCEVDRSRDAAAIVAAHNALPELLRLARERYALEAAVLALAEELDEQGHLFAALPDPYSIGIGDARIFAAKRLRSTVTAALAGPHTTDEEADRG